MYFNAEQGALSNESGSENCKTGTRRYFQKKLYEPSTKAIHPNSFFSSMHTHKLLLHKLKLFSYTLLEEKWV